MEETYPEACYWYDEETKKCQLNPVYKQDPQLLAAIRAVNTVAAQDEDDCTCK